MLNLNVNQENNLVKTIFFTILFLLLHFQHILISVCLYSWALTFMSITLLLRPLFLLLITHRDDNSGAEPNTWGSAFTPPDGVVTGG